MSRTYKTVPEEIELFTEDAMPKNPSFLYNLKDATATVLEKINKGLKNKPLQAHELLRENVSPSNNSHKSIGGKIIDSYKDGWKWKLLVTGGITVGIGLVAGLKGNEILGYTVEGLTELAKGEAAYRLNFGILYPFSHLRSFVSNLIGQVGYNAGEIVVGSWAHTRDPSLTMNVNRVFNGIGNYVSLYNIISGIHSLKKRFSKK